MRELGRSLKAGLFVAWGGVMVLFMLEILSFFATARRSLFLSGGEALLFFLCLLGAYSLAAVGLGLVEGFACYGALAAGSRRQEPKRRLDRSSLLYAFFFALVLLVYAVFRNCIPQGLLIPEKRFLYLSLLGLSLLCSSAAILPLYRVQRFRAGIVRETRGPFPGRRGSGGLLILIAVPCLLVIHYANTHFYVRLYTYVHNMLSMVTFWFGELLFVGVIRVLSRSPSPRLGRGWGTALAAALLVPIIAFTPCIDVNQNVKRIVLLETVGGRKLIPYLQRLFDFDRDGYSSLLGGGDSNDRDASINPGAYDIPGNGIDEDGWGGDRQPSAAAPPAMPLPETLPEYLSLVFVTIDAARADHLSCYGYKRETTPCIDALAKRSVLFENAYSLSSASIFAMNGLMTSRYPSWVTRGEEVVTLAEILRQNGFATGVVSVRYNWKLVGWRYVFFGGFPEKDRELFPPWAEDVTLSGRLTDMALGFLEENRGERFFLWLTYPDPHANYLPNPETEAWGSGMVDRYDGELRRADAAFGSFLRGLEKLGLFNDTVIAVFGDHGEEFREHGGQTHAVTLYNESVHVPLIVYIPGVESRVVETPVSMIDLAPTVLNLLGVARPPCMEGRSLLPLIVGRGDLWMERPVFLENPKTFKKAVIQQGWKLIYDYRYNTFELYDLSRDPGERINLFDRRTDVASELQHSLFQKF